MKSKPSGATTVEERWVEDVERALVKADKHTTHAVDTDSAEKLKATATSGG